ncbi:twin-arginine translocase TatA/TatE family subunit [Candidatus Calescamantes bacterium]|nr:twin-arginine translocase TatA/TatE family subunit [Candidatus Calescamantes bacterium]
MLGNIGWSELIIIFLVVLLLFGAKRLPEVGKALGKAIREFKKGLQGVKEEPKESDEKEDK